jgi:hypothetical protein
MMPTGQPVVMVWILRLEQPLSQRAVVAEAGTQLLLLVALVVPAVAVE